MLGIVLVLGLLLVGCEDAKNTVTETGTDVDVKTVDNKVIAESDDGKVEVTGTNIEGKDWCKEGAEWKMTSTTDEGNANAKWIIKELVKTGEFADLCHVEYTINTEQGTTKIDYYFSQDGESGYMMMDANGQKFKQEWHKQ